MFVLQNAPRAPAALPGLRLEGVPSDGGMALFDLTLSVDESDADLLITLEYDKDLFEEATMHRMAAHYRRLLEGIVADVNQRISHLPLLGEAERSQVLATGCGPVRAFPLDSCLHQQFEAQARRTPDATALEHGDQRLTYRELNEQANRVAHLLRQAGVGRGDFVVILQERGPDFLTAMLATFKAGAAYVPIDTNYPPDRVRYLLDRCEARTLLSHYALVGRFNDLLVSCNELRTLVCFDDTPRDFAVVVHNGDLAVYDRSSLARFAATDPCHVNEPSDPLYMIFTSGSTGPPKGVVIRHDAALNHIYAQLDALGLESGFSFLQSAPSCSDISVWQFLAPVLTGGRVIVADEEVLLAPPKLFATLQDSRVTIAELVPAILRMLTEYAASLSAQQRGLPDLKWMMVTGEAAPVETVNAWLRAYPAIPVVNAYGPTEAADDVLQAIIDRPLPERSRSVPIGRPLANLRIYIVDGHLQLVPTGVVGEICVGGVAVGVGYWKDEERTQASFVADPFGDQLGARMYRTGDLGRWLPDGTVEFLGRRDGQVKVRGFRVELGEIEAVLRQHPAVKEAAVVVTDAGGKACSSPATDGERELAAYVVAAAGLPAAADLRAFLRTKLPAHMVPAAIVFLQRLPLTPSGKVDRRALPAVDVTLVVPSKANQTPRTLFEQTLTEIWQDILGIERIGIEDNFFELGGHSLLAAQMLFRIHNLMGRTLPLRVLFEKPTIQELAKALTWAPEHRGPVAVPLRPQGSKKPFFCIHPQGGTALCYFTLARYLGADQPFYAIRAPELAGEREPFECIEDMATYYIDAVRRVQPEGPYLLGGWSMGGVIAFEMARQLDAKAARVGLVALLDTEPPAPAVSPSTYPVPDSVREGRMKAQDDATLLAEIASDLKIPVSRRKLLRLRPEERLEYMVQQTATSEGDLEDVRNSVNRYFTTCKAHEIALAVYRPSIYAGSVTLFHCQSKRGKRGKEYMHGWRKLAAGGVQTHEIPGNHQTMITEPSVRILARMLQASIDATLGES
jgi:amino acid adenylation domain-containing protein